LSLQCKIVHVSLYFGHSKSNENFRVFNLNMKAIKGNFLEL
jgi:hypothetical protein